MKRMALFLFVSVLCSILAADERNLPAEKKANPGANTFVLLIGINKYPTNIPSLDYCVRDTEGLAASLKKVGVPAENIIVMVDDADDVSFRPSRSNILQQIKLITGLVTENDQLVVSFSGHGAEFGGETYLCPNDLDLDEPDSFLPRKWVCNELEQCPARKKLFITDSCRNEISVKGARSGIGAKSLDNPLSDLDSQGFAILASCSKKQKSYEDDSLKHGVFTYFIMKGLEGEAANEKGEVTFDGLYDYVLQNTRSHVLKTRKKAQVPTKGGEFSGNFVLVSIPVTPKPKPTAKPEAVKPVVVQDGRKAGDRMELTIKGVKYAFRWCPAGKFMMGSPKSEMERGDNETQHQVTLTKGFWMLETEVTQEMWESVTGSNPSDFKGSKKLPVETVSWEDCQDYIEKLNALKAAPAGYKFSLPTEAQWEYACRAGTTTPYHFGSVLNGDKANCNGDYPYGTSTKGKNLQKTTVVGSYPVNAWGLYDMHGNVYEWCLDWYDDYPGGSVTDPTGPTTASNRVIRGGCWNLIAWSCRSASRHYYDPSYRNRIIGLRLALVRD